MALSKDHIREVFNKHASKTVNATELQSYILEGLNKYFSSDELENLTDTLRNTSKKLGTSMKGLYMSERGVYIKLREFSVEMKKWLETPHLSDDFAERLIQVIDEALQNAADYTDTVKSRKLKLKTFNPGKFLP